MEKGDFYSIVWIIGIYAYMFLIQALVPQKPAQSYWSSGGVVIMLLGLIGQELYFWSKTVPYNCIRADVFPSGEHMTFFVKKGALLSRRESQNLYSTPLELAYPYKHKEFGVCNTIVFQHEHQISDRLGFDHGTAIFQGYAVKHPNVAKVVLYEMDEGGYDVDHAKPVPIFFLKHAPKDYLLPTTPSGSMSSELNSTSKRDVSNLVLKVQKLNVSLAEKTREAHSWHQKAVRLGEYVQHLRNELVGVLKSKTDVVRASHELMLMIRQEQVTIENALRGKSLTSYFRKEFIYLIIAGMVFAFIGLNKDLQQGFGIWMSSSMNQLFILIALVMIVLIVYYLVGRRQKNK